MAKTSASVVRVAPTVVGAQSVETVAPVQPPAKKRRKPRRTQYTIEGKVARKLEATPVDFNPQTQRLTRGQFATMSAYYTHVADMARARAERYAGLAADAAAHPEKYGRVGRVTKLAARVAALEQALIAKGFTAEQIAALLAE